MSVTYQYPFTASNDLSEVWKESCMKVLGFGDFSTVVKAKRVGGKRKSSAKIQILNLLPKSNNNEEDEKKEDIEEESINTWIKTALQIQSNLYKMKDFINQKKDEYISIEMTEEEATLIQSTVTSFTATTANEIESLHKCIDSTNANIQKQQHYSSIIQILMQQLKEGIVEPFNMYQKQRHRPAVNIWQTPLQCRLMIPKIGNKNNNNDGKEDPALDALLGLNDDESERQGNNNNNNTRDQRFIPTRPSHRLHRDFLSSYETSATTNSRPMKRPKSILAPETERKFQVTPTDTTIMQNKFGNKASRFEQQEQQVVFNEQENATNLQQESILLQAKTYNDLDSVQQMEQTMVNITTLLTQFTNLLTEQQENIYEIHDSATNTKDNIQKGQENLIDAKERTSSSKHYMATGITSMAILLLLMNWIVQ